MTVAGRNGNVSVFSQFRELLFKSFVGTKDQFGCSSEYGSGKNFTCCSYDFSKMLYKFYSLSLMRIEGKCDRPVSLEESITLAANPCKRRVISLVRYHLYQHCA